METKINKDRLWSDLMEVGRIGFVQGKGVTRTAFSEADIKARGWLRSKMEAAGLNVRMDKAANIIGTLKSPSASSDKVLVVCSHLDTVPEGGMFDGALGVVAGLECARILKENGISLPWDLEIIDFSDEEAAYNAGTVGSRAMMGHLSGDEIFISRSKAKPSFAQAMKGSGVDPADIGDAARDPESFAGVLELHIEQGSRLETGGIDIGAVTGIVGIYRYIITVEGAADHAGTTPMELRNDALVKAAPVFLLLPQWVRARSKEMVGTIGQVALEPGTMNVIPGECSFVVELRSMNREDMKAIRDILGKWVEHTPGFSMKPILEKESVALSDPFIETIVQSAEAEGLSCERMPSGAGHDAQSFAAFVPTGMIFVPCRYGKSHCPDEWIEPRQAAEGCRVLLRTVLELARKWKGL